MLAGISGRSMEGNVTPGLYISIMLMVVVFIHKFLVHDKYVECQTTTLQDASLLLCLNSHQQLLKCNSA